MAAGFDPARADFRGRLLRTGKTGRVWTSLSPDAASIDALVERGALAALAAVHGDALGAPRQRARFLRGLSSPATSRAKLTRDPLFGVLERRFADVLAWCSE